MGFSHYHRFFSKIDGRHAISFLYGLDYSLTTSKERIDTVNEIINGSIVAPSENDYNKDTRNWFEKYTDDYYKTGLTSGLQGDALAHENNVFCVLEKLGTYILWSEDNKQKERSEKYVYKYYDDEAKFLNKVRTRERSYDSMVNKGGAENNYDEVIHYLMQTGKNYKKSKDIEVKQSDVNENSYCGAVLREYDSLIELIREEVRNTDDYRYKRSIQALMPEIRTDMVISKTKIKGIFDSSPNKLIAESTVINWDEIDLYDKDTVKALMQYCKLGNIQDFQEDKQCVIYDFVNLVERAKSTGRINNQNIKVLNYYEKGMTTEQIGNLLGKSRQAVRVNINTICNAIVKQYEDYIEDWLYTFHRKGSYKTCNCCKETKLTTKFSKQLSNRDGLKTFCKTCESKKRQLRSEQVIA